MCRRRECFNRMKLYLALWLASAGYRSTILEGKARLESGSRGGTSTYVHFFHRPYPPQGLPRDCFRPEVHA